MSEPIFTSGLSIIQKDLNLESMAKQPQSKVSEVASEYHFTHMGHFSAEFKKMFRQTPSEILQSSRN